MLPTVSRIVISSHPPMSRRNFDRMARWNRSFVRRGVWASALLGLVAVIVPAPRAGAVIPASVPTPPEASPSFPPGSWKGVAVGTGGINFADASARAADPIIYRFEFDVAPDGAVTNGLWYWDGPLVSEADDMGASFTYTASGTLGGTGARVEIAGVVHMSGSVTVQGNVMPVENDMPAGGAFSPMSVSCNVVSGNLAQEGLQAGVASSVTAPFTAHRIAAAGEAGVPGFEETYTELVLTVQNLLAAGQPPAADVVELAERAEAFYQEVFASASCPDGATNLQPGKQPYTYFVELLSQVLLTALADPSGYTADDIHALAIAAVRIGVVGAAAPDPELAAQVRTALFDAVESKLADAQATQDKAACTIVVITATSMGFTELVGPAQACAGA